MEIGKAAGADGEESFEEEYEKTSELAVQAVYRGSGGKGPSWSVQKYFNSGKGEKKSESCWKGTVVRERRQGGREKGTSEFVGVVGKTGHIAANCVKVSWNRSLNVAEEDTR